MKKAFVSTTLLTGLILASCPAWAGHRGDISCAPQWKFCLQSVSLSMDQQLHYITSVRINGQSMAFNDGQVRMAIQNSTGLVGLIAPNHAPVWIGQITEAVGSDANTALSREMAPAAGVNLQVFSQQGKDVSYCNTTAIGFVTEWNYYHTVNHLLAVTENGQNLTQFSSTELVQPPYRTTTSIFSCPRNGR